MDTNLFIQKGKELVATYTQDNINKTNRIITPEDVYVVWFCKTLENAKVLMGTPLSDGMYYELTYSGSYNAIFFDAYKKEHNMIVPFKGGL